MVETQGGGTLHAHFIIWLSKWLCNSAEYEQMFESDMERKLLVKSIEAYSASIVSNTLPLSLEAHCCPICRSTYDNLEAMPIPQTALMKSKENGEHQAPVLVKCGICQMEFSSQEVLRRILLEHRPAVWPPPLRTMTPDHFNRRAQVEACCRYDILHAIRAIKQRDYLCESCDKLMASPNVLELPQKLSVQSTLRDDPIVRQIEMLPPMDDDSRLTPQNFQFMVSALVLLLNEHWWTHTGSCFKESRVASTAGFCRYLFPRERVPATQFSTRGVAICRKPAHEYINGYNPVIMAAFKSNHDIQILFGGKDVANRIYYCCKYVTKSQNQIDSVAVVALAAFRRREEKEAAGLKAGASRAERIQISRKRVAALAYNLSNRQEVAGPLAALYIQRGSCAYSSSRCERLLLSNIFAQLLGNDGYSCDLVEIEDETAVTQTSSRSCAYRSVAALDDYRYRPSKQEDVNLYKFHMKYFRRKVTKATSKEVLFLTDHPLAGTYCLGIRSRDVVPVIFGPRMPYVDERSPAEVKALRSRIALVLFKPFRTLRDLVDNDNPTDWDWTRAYTVWEQQRTRFDITIMSNMDDYYSGREQAAVDRKTHDSQEADNDSDDSSDDTNALHLAGDSLFGNRAGDSTDMGSDSEYVSSCNGEPPTTTQLNPARFPGIPEAPSHSKDAVNAIIDNGMLANVAAQTASIFIQLNRKAALTSGFQSFPRVGFLRRWVKDGETDNKLVADTTPEKPAMRTTEVVELIRDALRPENMIWQSGRNCSSRMSAYPTLSEISQEFTLNPPQHAAFCKIGKGLFTRWLKADPSQADYQGINFENKLAHDQLLFFLGGAGGTGKSRVVDAVTRLCSRWKRDSCVLKTALTGKAATLIQGRTLASFMLSLERSKGANLIGVDMLVIDEISMLTKTSWLKLDRLLRRNKRVSGVHFGGIHIVLVGDFLQLPPVGADPIYIDPRNKQTFSTTDIEGFLLWRRFETVIVLEESVRFRDDPEWGAGCAAARLGNWTSDFINLINARHVDKAHDIHWSADTVFVSPDNSTRTAINNEFLKATAKRLAPGNYPVRVIANFQGSLSGLSRQDVEYVMGLPDTRFGRMPPFIDLVEGMPIQVTQNVRPAKGAANGTLGALEHLIFSPDTSFKVVRDNRADMLVRVPNKPPLYAMLRINRGANSAPFNEDVDPELFPVFYDAQAFSKSSVSLPRSPTGERRSLSVKLQQLPIVSAVGSTIYKVQGETLRSMVVVEWKSPIAIVNKPQQTYLLVSRVVSRFAFSTLTQFTAELAEWSRPPPAALEEEIRLQELSHITLQALQQELLI